MIKSVEFYFILKDMPPLSTMSKRVKMIQIDNFFRKIMCRK